MKRISTTHTQTPGRHCKVLFFPFQHGSYCSPLGSDCSSSSNVAAALDRVPVLSECVAVTSGGIMVIGHANNIYIWRHVDTDVAMIFDDDDTLWALPVLRPVEYNRAGGWQGPASDSVILAPLICHMFNFQLASVRILTYHSCLTMLLLTLWSWYNDIVMLDVRVDLILPLVFLVWLHFGWSLKVVFKFCFAIKWLLLQVCNVDQMFERVWSGGDGDEDWRIEWPLHQRCTKWVLVGGISSE